MSYGHGEKWVLAMLAAASVAGRAQAAPGAAAAVSTNSVADPGGPATSAAKPAIGKSAETAAQSWNWHLQNTDIVQGYPAFPARYSGPNSLPDGGEVRETVSLDVMAGLRLWPGAEAHVDALVWQGFGVGGTLGVEGFPNGEAFRLGTDVPNANVPRLFIRQTIGLGGEREAVPDGPLTLAGQEDISRLTFTIGRFSAKDRFDNNAYANNPRTQFLNWGLMANEAWDYPADALGYTTGFAAELNQAQWTLRYGFFQMPRVSNGTALDSHFAKAWGMVTELEWRYSVHHHPGAIRFLAYLNRAHMGSYQAAVDSFDQGGSIDISATRAYRSKSGFGLNWEQELAKNVGVFSRLGWSNGRNEAWVFSDVDCAASLGGSVKGEAWHRPDDTFGLAGLINGLSRAHQAFFADGGTGILGGDGALTYGWEKILETYYDFRIWRSLHGAFDYQYVVDPAFNQARGPISIFGARLHWEF